MRFSSFQPAKIADRRDNLVVCLDLDGHLVKISLIAIGQQLTVIGYSQKIWSLKQSFNQASDLKILQKTIEQTLEQAQDKRSFNLKYLMIGLGGDLIEPLTHTSRIRRFDKTASIKQKELNRLIAQNQAEALDLALERMQFNNQRPDLDLKLLNSSLVSFNLDGQSLDDPLDKIGTSIGVTLYNVFIAKEWYKTIDNLASSLNLELISLAYKPFALSQALVGHQAKDVDALIIHMEVSTTYLIVLESGVVTETASFNLGEDNFNLALARNLKLSYKQALKLRDLNLDFNFAHLGESQQKQASNIVNHSLAVWLRGLFLTLVEMEAQSLPAKIYLSGRAADFNLIKTSLEKVDLTKIVQFKSPIEFQALDIKDLPQTDIKIKARVNFSNLSASLGLARLAHDILEATNKLPKSISSSSDQSITSPTE